MLERKFQAVQVVHQLTVKCDYMRALVYQATTESHYAKAEGELGIKRFCYFG